MAFHPALSPPRLERIDLPQVSGGAAGDRAGSAALVCVPCAAAAFPEFSLDPAAEVKYKYGDDGPVSAMEVQVEVPGIRAELLAAEASSGGVTGQSSEGLEWLMVHEAGPRRG